MDKIELGQTVKDEITGYTGIAIGRSTWLHGCDTIGVQAKIKDDGVVPDVRWVDELRLKGLEKDPDKGGPQITPQRGNSNPT